VPDAVYRELLEMLFSMAVPVVAMGVACVGLGAMIVWRWGDPVIAAITAAAAIVTVLRLLVIRGYRRQVPASLPVADLRRWERRYAIGNYAFALLLGLLNARMLMFHLPLIHMITVSLVFTFGAGVVSRISIRPVICVISLLLAVVPTVLGLILHAFSPDADPLHAEMFAVEALVVAGTTVLSLQSVRHLYRTMVEHLTVKHDLTFLAKQDALTKLPNRLLLRERFQQEIAPVSRSGGRLALHFLDLDGFKAVNDIHGHPAGDAVLREVARRLTATVRSGDIVSRLGGDEFVVIQAGIGHHDEAEMLARRIIRALSAPYEIEGKTMRISVSIGIALAPEQGLDLENLVTCADMALYRAKGSGKSQLRFYGSADADGDAAKEAVA
jgi:diguanylate cyclase (GGDEF)-like protein